MKRQLTNRQIEELIALKRKSKRSWGQLRQACLELTKKPFRHTTYMVGASSRSFARNALKLTGADLEQILDWLKSSQPTIKKN